MNRYSKILHHIGPTKEPKTSESSSDRKRRTFEEYEAEQKKTEVDRLKEQTQQLTENIEFLQNLVVNQHDDVYELRQQLKSTPIPQPKVNLTEGLLNEPPNVKNSDPLTPLDQNFVTLDQLNDHYQLFINRIQQQMATIGGGGETQFKFLDDIRNFIFVGSKNDLPPAVGGVITLKDNYTYFFTTTVDLQGNRLVAGQNTTILGGSSENCRIKSTGISTTTALLSSNYSLPLRNITLEAPYAINLDATGYGTQALDWFGVNFTDCAKVGIISSYNNFIMLDGAFLNSQDLTFNGTTGTVGFNQCLFTGNFGLGGTKSILNFPSTFICRRRIRVTVCSFVVPSGYTGITVQDGVQFRSANGTYNPESFILQTCNFSGPGITPSGILTNALGISTHTNIDGIDSFFEGNRGIDNTFVIGQYYMKNNSTETSFASADTYTKIVGITTTLGSTNSKFIATDNRLTCNAGIERQYLTQVSATVVASVSTNCSLAIFDSSDGDGILQASTLEVETLAGVPIVVHITDVHKHILNDYLEVHISNIEGTDPVTVTSLNVLATQLG
jgi:hypothetical protein